jgi:hypothetical protein
MAGAELERIHHRVLSARMHRIHPEFNGHMKEAHFDTATATTAAA